MNKEQQKKILIMKVGVTVVVLVIIFIWAFNLKNVWLVEKSLAPAKDSSQDWQALKDNLEKTLNNVESSLAGLKEEADKKDREEKQAFLDDVLSGAKLIASSTDEATSSPVLPDAGVPKPSQQCPEYIDCMPTIGEAKPCQIPVGCEGITIIAY